MTTSNVDLGDSLGSNGGTSGETNSRLNGRSGRLGALRSARATLDMLLATVVAVGCAGQLEGDPSEYTGAYGTGGAGNLAGAAPVAGMSTGGSAGTAGQGQAGATAGATGQVVVPLEPPCVEQVLTKHSCSNLCHAPDFAKSIGGGFDITGADRGARLAMLQAQYLMISDTSGCEQGALIIDARDQAKSVLLRKVKGTQSCGTPMPQSGPLTGDDLKCIEDWINAFSVTSANQISLDSENSGTGGNR